MKTNHARLRRLILGFVLALSFIILPGTAQASGFDDFIGFIEELEGLAQEAGVNLPISSQQARDVEGLVLCLENSGSSDVQIALCIDQFQSTNAGSGISQQTGIPSWVWDMLDCYIYYRSGDYWGLAYKLGEAAVCLVLQIFTGGSDICGLIEELIRLANAVWDAANAIAQFFVSIGEAAYGVVKDVGCALGLGGCDDGPDSPPEAWVYSLVFSNRLADGLAAREAKDPSAFDTLVDQLRQNALHKPEPILSTTPPPDIWGLRDVIFGMFTPVAIEKAIEIYTLNVNIQWTADIAVRVLAERSQAMDQYKTPQKIHQLTQLALESYLPRSSWNPQMPIVNQVHQDLKFTFGFVHVDRWLQVTPVSKLGPQAAGIRPTVKSNYQLAGSFYQSIKNDLAQRVREHVKANYSPEIGGKLVAQTIDKHRTSLELLRPFNLDAECYANTVTCGKEAKGIIIGEFKKKGTQYYSDMEISNVGLVTQMLSFTPLTFTCFRPTHEHFFDYYYQIHFGDLPRKLLERTLKEEPAYIKLKQDVQAAIAQLNSKTDIISYGVTGVDPLVVVTASAEDLLKAETENTNFNFGPPSTKPGFEYSQQSWKSPTIDGRNTPVMYYDILGGLKDHMKSVSIPVAEKKFDFKNPTDPITEKLSRQDMMNPVANKLSISSSKLSETMKSAPGQAQGQTTQPMSGSLPPGQAPPTQPGWNNAIPLKRTPQPVATAASNLLSSELPDLTSGQPIINRTQARWNSTVDLTSLSGVLKFPLRFTIQNNGKASDSGSSISVSVSGKEVLNQALPPIPPGESIQIDTTLDLASGSYIMILMIDRSNQVREVNEGNNRFQINLNIKDNGTGKLLKPIESGPFVKPPARMR